MAFGNGPQQFRKAMGALKDSTKVGIATVNSEYKVTQAIKLYVYISFFKLMKKNNNVFSTL